MAAPVPTGPQCSTLRQSWSRIGLARAASAGSAPISPSNWPLRAGAVEPPTGHSTSAAPLARTLGARSVSTLGATVLISMNSLPLTSPDNSPFGPL